MGALDGARAHLRKAEEFLAAARDSLAAERFNAACSPYPSDPTASESRAGTVILAAWAVALGRLPGRPRSSPS